VVRKKGFFEIIIISLERNSKIIEKKSNGERERNIFGDFKIAK
jgi:hypothetical protein